MMRYVVITLILVVLMTGGSSVIVEASDIKLLFSYSLECPHCSYQKSIIGEFKKNHPEVDVKCVGYCNLNSEQRELIKGTSGHPVMVYYSRYHIRQVVGETSLSALDKEYDAFKKQMAGREEGISMVASGSRSVCF